MANLNAKDRITATFEFGPTGHVKAIFLNAATENDQRVLQKGLARLFSPSAFQWLKKFFTRRDVR